MALKYVQTLTLYQAGAGNIIGATSVVLVSLTDIYGNAITSMTPFGTKGYITLEPDTSNEEAATFTGITVNANGTVSLTGVSTILAQSPYTETSGLVRTHSGGTKAVVTDNVAFWNTFANKTNAETVTGKWTLPGDNVNRPTLGSDVDSVTATDLVTFGQMSRQAISGAANASTTVKGIVELATQAEIDARTTTGGTGALLVPTPDTTRSTLVSDYKIDTGAANAYVITPVPAVTAYTTGQEFTFKAVNANTTASTLNVSGLGTKAIVNSKGGALVANDILAGMLVTVKYDGTSLVMVNPVANAPTVTPAVLANFDYQSFTANGTWTKPSGLTGNELVIIQAWGGGGAGGSNAGSAGGGGGGGACVIAQFRVSDLSATEAVTVGATQSTPGSTGNSTTFGSHMTVFGGGGGFTSGGSQRGSGGGGGGTLDAGSGGAADGGSNANGGDGGAPARAVGTTGNGADSSFGGGAGGGLLSSGPVASSGGSSMYGGGGGGAGNNTNGTGGKSYYGGGGGGGGGGAAAGVSIMGGNGGAGGNNVNGSAGVAPAGGGGGASGTHTGGAGARGEVRVWTFL